VNHRRQHRHLELLCTLLVAGLILIVGMPTPTAAKAPNTPGSARASAASTNEVDLSWRVPAGTGVANYVIRRDGKDLATVDASTLIYIDTSVQPSTKYTYTIVAVDATGARSAESRQIKVKTPAPPELRDTLPPSSPEEFTVTAPATGGILLDWGEGGTDDSDISGYRIYRNGKVLLTLDAGALSYLDATAVPGTTYTYEVESLDIVGHHSKREKGSAASLTYPSQATIAASDLSLSATTTTALSGIATQLRRYPYLTDVVGQYATINWATDRSAITGSATWGQVAADGSCTPTNSVAATRTAITVNSVSEYQWKAMLTLSPNTQYCYRVFLKAVDLLGSDPAPQFWTQLPAGSTQPFSFVVFGDWGNTNSNGTNQDEANVMQQVANSGARFALTVGDNAYSSGSQTDFGDLIETGPSISSVFGPQFWAGPGRSMPIFPALGNHGYASTTSAHPELTNFPQDQAVALSGGKYARETYCCQNGTVSSSYPSAWYAFDAGGARFYVLSAAWADNNVGSTNMYDNDYDYHWTVSSAEYQWLENDLKTHPSALKFAFLHFPVYSDNTAQVSDTFLQGSGSLEGLLGRYGVDIAFDGHAHVYERTEPNGDGLVTYLTGGGGAKLATVRDCKANDAYALGWSFASNVGTACGAAPVPTAPDSVYHFLRVSVDGNSVTVTPTDEMGRTFDVQTYTFGSGGTADSQAPSAPTNLAATASSATQVNLSWTAATDNVGVTGYDVYRDGTLLQSLGVATSFSDTTVTASTNYSYTVKAKDAAGNISMASNTATVTTPADATPTTLTFVPDADTYVEQANPGTNFGTATKLLVDNSPVREGYLRFTVSGLSGSVQSATLRLFVTDSTSNGPAIYGVADTTWSETGLTWNNKPARGTTATDNKGAVSSGTWVEYNVTPLVTGNGAVSFALIGDSSNGLDVYSRQGTQPPQLVVKAGNSP
jgi:fibronectin type 3 domain-containing protein